MGFLRVFFCFLPCSQHRVPLKNQDGSIIMIINYEEMGKRIQKRRKELKLRQTQLAEETGISNHYLCNIENGRSIPSLEVFAEICNALKVTPDYLLLGNLRGNNMPMNLIDKIKLCNDEDAEKIEKIINGFI